MPSPQCPQFDPANPNARTWSCMDKDHDYEGCAPHCFPCAADETAAGVSGHHTHGGRWLRPHPGEYDGHGNYRPRESRDARGRIPFLRSGDPLYVKRWMPRGPSYHQAANCWRQCLGGYVQGLPDRAEEKFDVASLWTDPQTICACAAGDNWCGAWPPSSLCGWLATCSLFGGAGWPPEQFHCTGAGSDNFPLTVRLASWQSAYNNAALVTFGSGESRDHHNDCAHNWAVQCWGHRVNDQGTGCATLPFDVDDYYNQEVANAYQAFDYLYVGRLGPDAAHPEAGAWFAGNSPESVLKNQLMRYLEADRAAGINGLHRFDQLDSGRRYASPAQNLNASLSQFGRDWNFDAPPIPLSQLPAVAQLTGILRRTGLTFPAAWVIVNATLRVSIILYGRKTRHHWTPNPESIHYNQTYPLVRVELICNMGLRADLTGWPKTYVKSWDPALPEEQIYLQNNDAGPLRTYPTVLPAGRDEIIYQHEGDFVTPPNRVRWYGHLGFLSDPETMDVYPHELQTGLGYSCCYLKRGFNQGKFSTGTAVGRTIPALASHCDAVPDERHLIWKGGIRLAFDTDDQPC